MPRKRSNRRAAVSPKDHQQEASLAQVVLILALPEEREYFHGAISERPNWEASSERKRYRCSYSGPRGKVEVTVQTLDGMGHIEAVIGTSSVIATRDPTLVIMVGIAGSLVPSKVGLGDVVVSNHAKLFASDKVAQIPNGATQPEYIFGMEDRLQEARARGQFVVDERDRFLTSSFLRYERKYIESPHMDDLLTDIEKSISGLPLTELPKEDLPNRFAELLSSKRSRKVHFGWILGSHHVVDSAEYRDYLTEKNTKLELDIHRQKGDHDRVLWKDGELLAVDMESYGVLRAVETARTTPPRDGGCSNLVGGVIVRGISDICEYKGDLDKTTGNSIRRLAVENATNVALSLIEAIDFADFEQD